MKTVLTCPLGSECEKIVGDHIERCVWFVELKGHNPQNGKEIDQSKCAIAWQPILMVEGNGVSYNIGASIQSLRNETVSRQNIALKSVRSICESSQD